MEKEVEAPPGIVAASRNPMDDEDNSSRRNRRSFLVVSLGLENCAWYPSDGGCVGCCPTIIGTHHTRHDDSACGRIEVHAAWADNDIYNLQEAARRLQGPLVYKEGHMWVCVRSLAVQVLFVCIKEVEECLG